MDEPQRKPPSAWWYAVAAAVFVLGLAPLAVVATNALGGLLDYEVHDFDDAKSTEIEVADDPVAIYTTYDGVGTVRCNGVGPGLDAPDNADGAAQAAVFPLDHPTWNFEFSNGAEVWHRVAVTPGDWDTGTYSIACNLVSPGAGSPEPQLGYADNPSVLGTILGVVISVGIAGLATLAALIIVVVVAVKRSRVKRPPLPDRPVFPPGPPPAY
ncbi:hypothetical protein [Solicola gregarius]|uniref:Uncharacterized protein n=1 Tax=Solicola gregarius TaxID=2908642 RepID=A0AA46TLH1_9ACTN|nr:hypothetical protein [Solicola gregarius]UYM07112.1 hypothetical protein L0C25_08560 [Solicola gregarius]